MVQQHVLQPAAHCLRVQRLGAHQGVRVERPDDRVHQLRLEVRRVGELLLRVVRGLLRALRVNMSETRRPFDFTEQGDERTYDVEDTHPSQAAA